MQFSYLIPVSLLSSLLITWKQDCINSEGWGELQHLFACYLHDLEACLLSHLLCKDVCSVRPCFMWFMGIMGLLEQATPGVGVRIAGLAFSLIYCNRQNAKQVILFNFIF